MHDHRPTIAGRTRAAWLDAGDTCRQGRGSLTALKRLESESGLEVYESTRDQVRRAFEGNGVIFLDSDRGIGVLLVDEKHRQSRPSP